MSDFALTVPQPPTISVVTPSFNHDRFIEAAVLSVLHQDYPPLDYWVMDGGSTDQTAQILRQHESRLGWVSQKDNGQADAINLGFAKCRGEIFGWLNSDDTYAPGAFAAVAECFAENPDAGIVYGNADFIDAAGKRICPCAHIEPFDRWRLLNVGDYIVQPAAFFRADLFRAVGGLDASLHWAMDYDFWLKAAERTSFVYLPRVLANYRWLDESKTGSGGWPRLEEVKAVARRHGAKRVPTYFQLESVRLWAIEAARFARSGRIDLATGRVMTVAATVLSSPRLLASLLSPKVWKINYTGHVLRRAAARA
ncbi:MAG: glycosyltransferase family 2 protein [Tepidisphaeraceae bacterium]